jgi:hypothetical protein
MTAEGPGNLSQSELETLANFFIAGMTMTQRHKLMATNPQLYAKMYPSVNAEVIARQVRLEILNNRPAEDEPLAEWEKELLGKSRDASKLPAVVDFIERNQKILAIKKYREIHSCSLLDAKNAVDAVWHRFNHDNPAIPDY